MAKRKKLSIKFSVNTNLQPTPIQGKDHYPLYARVTYDRKSTRFRVLDYYESSILLPENDQHIEKLFSKPDYQDTKSLYHLRELVDYEEKLLRERHSIIGIGDRMNNIYLRPILDHFRGAGSLLSFMLANVGHEWLAFDQIYDNFKLYHIAKFDLPDIKDKLPEAIANSFIVETLLQIFSQKKGLDLVIDIRTYKWIAGALRDQFKEFLLHFSPSTLTSDELRQTAGFFEDFPFEKSSIDKYLNVIDFAIDEKILWDK